MNRPISPWKDRAELLSPDGCFKAVYDNGAEVAMGAPTRGRLRLIEVKEHNNEMVITTDAAASVVWSDGSNYLAFTKWRRNRKQSLCVFRISDFQLDESPDEFSVIELHSFKNNKISGVDSPVWQPIIFSLRYYENGEQTSGADGVQFAGLS
jgi:hypothetical protein